MTISKPLNRRTMLRGAGSIAIGLPFLEEMAPRVVAAPGDAPARLITLFFGLGLSQEQQLEEFSGALEPYKPYKDKMALFTSVDMSQGKGGGAHFEGSPVIFVGEKKRGEVRAGGASIDQLMRRGAGGNTPIGSMAAGMWFREGCRCQPLRTWNPDGSVANNPIKRPSALFDRVFGSFKPPKNQPAPPANNPAPEPAPMADPTEVAELHLKRSILDTVLDQYQHLSGNASRLGALSKGKLTTHLERLREVERKLMPADEVARLMDGGVANPGDMPSGGSPGVISDGCRLPPKPKDPGLGANYETKGGTGGSSPEVDRNAFANAFRAQADIFAMAIACDIFRFGNLMFESAGGHTRFKGSYSALGDTVNFPAKQSEHGAFWHNNQPADARVVQHFFQSNLAYFLSLLDDPNNKEQNGKTLLDNTLVVIGSEVGWNHSLKNVFHGVVGGHGHFRPGTYKQELNCADIYNTLMKPYGVSANVGAAHRTGEISGFLA